MKVRLTKDCRGTLNSGRIGRKPKGTEIDHPDAYLLVESGVATAIDEECEQKLARRGFDKHGRRMAKAEAVKASAKEAKGKQTASS